MPQNKKGLEALLAYKDAHAPCVKLDEHQPHALVKRHLKLLGRLNNASKLSPEELDRLTEQELKKTISAYSTRLRQSPPTAVIPTTASEFFHSRMNQSPYLYDIIAYSEHLPHRATQSQNTTLSTSKQTHPMATEQVHGFHLKEEEAFSSTRYFSEDKKSFAKIIVKNGTFTATYEQLNDAQEIDLALEMSYQFLLNLPPEKKEVSINGSAKNIHRVHAALLYLQKEAGSQFADLKFKFPEGMSIPPQEVNKDYIKKHLGTLNTPPQQIVQWRDFLNLKRNTPTNEADTLLQPTSKTFVDEPTKREISPKKERAPLIDMECVFQSDALSQHDKVHLNEYQHYLKEVWIKGAIKLKEHAGDTEYLITEHEEFMQRTEATLRLLKNDPSLKQEYEALTSLYTNEMESQQHLLEELYQNDLDYETKVKELMPQLQKANRQAMDECLRWISQHLETERTLNPDLSKAQHDNLNHHTKAMHEIKSLLQSQEELSDEMRRSFGAQIGRAITCLESIKDYSNSPLFQDMKKFSQEQCVPQSRPTYTNTERLLHASSQVKQRLNQFKSELQDPNDTEVSLSAELKEQLGSLAIKIKRSAAGLEAENVNDALKKLSNLVEKMSTNAKTDFSELNTLKQTLEESLPHIENNPGLVKAITELKKQMKASMEPIPLPNEHHTQQGLSM